MAGGIEFVGAKGVHAADLMAEVLQRENLYPVPIEVGITRPKPVKCMGVSVFN